MKKLLALTLSIILAVALVPMSALTASAETSGYYTYSVSNGEATITDVDTSINGDIEIPSTLGGYPVTSIGNRAFEICSSLTSITIPDSVTSIGDDAFYYCSSIEKVYITDISKWCGINFGGLHSNPLSNGADLYLNGSKVTDVEIPSGITSIGDYAFYNCRSLTSIIIPDSVTSIGDCAFHNCRSLTSITIPDSVTSIGNSAFSDCRSLTSITIPDSVTSIGNSAFWNCSSLTSITIGNSVTSIGKSAFYSCSSLTSITIPDSVTSIGDEAFFVCSSLTSITIPDSVTSIGKSAFNSCSSLKSITIPDSVTSIGDYAFYYCSSITSITIQDGVTSIGDNAFSGCSSLRSITIPDSVTSIGYRVFYGCSSLTSITIPDSVTSIGEYAFEYCRSLWHVIYAGTENEWNNIIIGSYNSNLTNAKRHYNATDAISSIVTEQPTCETNGSELYSCSLCGETRTGNIPALGHSGAFVETVDPTCTENGYDVYHCDRCNEDYHSNDTPAFGYPHTYDNACDKDCNVCGEIREVPDHVYDNVCDTDCNICSNERTVKHEYKITGAKDPTCIANGYTGDKVCSICKKVAQKGKTINKLGHKTKTVTTKATLSKNGSVVKKCSVCGKTESTTVIYSPKTFKLSATSYTYSGGYKKPTVTVKDSKGKTLKNGTDYTVSYKNNKNVGTATATVTFKGKYSGSKKLSFTIKSKTTSLSKLTVGKKQLTVSWKKNSSVSGYQIQYSTSNRFSSAKTVTVKSYKTTSLTLKNLKSKKAYYVRIRTYKTVNGKKLYSDWSAKALKKTTK